jgi:hypothetical protein
MLNPSTFQLSSIAILQQQSDIFYRAIQRLIRETTRFFDIIRMIEDLYSVQDVKIVSGTVAYPNASTSNERGMSFELRYGFQRSAF